MSDDPLSENVTVFVLLLIRLCVLLQYVYLCINTKNLSVGENVIKRD